MNLVCRYIYISRHDDEEDDKEVDAGVGGAAELAWGGEGGSQIFVSEYLYVKSVLPPI